MIRSALSSSVIGCEDGLCVAPLPWDKGIDEKTTPRARRAADAAMTREVLMDATRRRRG